MLHNSHIEKYLGYDKETGFYSHEILIEDSDFVEHVVISRSFSDSAHINIVALIQVYEKRKIDVSYNLYLFCRKTEEERNWMILNQLSNYEDCVKEYFPYRKQVLDYHKRYNKQKVFW